MENLKDLKITAYRLAKGDYLGGVTFYDPKLPKPVDLSKSFRDRYKPSVRVTFIYEKDPISLEQIIHFDNQNLEDYLEENGLMNQFLQLVDEATINDDYRIVY